MNNGYIYIVLAAELRVKKSSIYLPLNDPQRNKGYFVGMGWMSHGWCVLFTSVFVSAIERSSHTLSCLPNLNYFISITCPDNKFTSGHGRRISPSPGAAFVHAHPIDRTSHLQVWGVLIIVIGLQYLIKMVDLPFCLATSLIILYCFTASMNY